jgi:hypothetical protein
MDKNTIEMLQRVQNLGFTLDEALQLRRISMTLSRWNELKCGDGNSYGSWAITRGHKVKGVFTYDDDGLPFMEHHHYRHGNGQDTTTYTRISDREAGAQKRCDKLMANHTDLVAYYQDDPRGASLYIVKRSDLNGSDISSTYTRGVAIYK